MPTILPKPTARAWDDFSQYVPLLLDAIDAELMRDDAWDDADRDDALQYIADLKTYIVELPDLVNRRADSEISLSPFVMTITFGNGLTWSSSSSQRDGGSWFQNSAVNGQELVAMRYMAKGTWAYRVTAIRTSGSGILRVLLSYPDATSQSFTHDAYVAGANQFNQAFSNTFTVPVDGAINISLQTLNKHASSSGYLQLITCLEMWRTGD